MNRKSKVALAATAAVSMFAISSPLVSHAATPNIVTDDGAYVRLLGNPDDGTAKFQFGWYESTPASDAAGYWVGVYDVTNSHYVWSYDTGSISLPDQLLRNAKPTAELPNGEYKVVFFVRDTYDPATNISEIELPFTVSNSDS